MCEGENTFLKVNHLGGNKVLMVYLCSITLIPYLVGLLRQSHQLRPLSVIRCVGLANEYNCVQSLINLKKL